LVQSQITIRPPQLGVDYTTPASTLASVNAQTGLGADNIVSLRGINYYGGGGDGGNWMGIDYVQLNQVALQFLTTTVNNGVVTLTWSGSGRLEWAPSVDGPWTPIEPAPQSGYTEAQEPDDGRFYRLRSD